MNQQDEPRAVHRCECRTCQAGEDQATITDHADLNLFLSRLNEPQRQWYAALLAQEPPGFSDSELERMTGLDRNTIRRGRHELAPGLSGFPLAGQRRSGGGRPKAEKRPGVD